MKIYKQQPKTSFDPADSLRDTFNKKELDLLYALSRLPVNRNNYLFKYGFDESRIVRNSYWFEFFKVDDFLVTFYELLNGNKLNLDDKDYKLLYKIVDKVACIRYRNILANKPKYEALLDRQWIG
jgi:hypothetical protein